MAATSVVPQDYIGVLHEHRGGFNFDNTFRNQTMADKMTQSRCFEAKKTGTTICGIVVKDAVILGADTRATEGTIVADKNCEKLHYIADNIYCAGAGTAADLMHTTSLISSQMTLHRFATKTPSRVCTVVRRLSKMLFRYQGHIGCALVLGGVDLNGPQLYQIYPHGSTDMLPFTCMGSGSLAAMSVLESRYRDDMTIEEGKQLVADAIRAGIFNDLGSGGNVDVTVVTKDGAKNFRGYDTPNPRLYRAEYRPFPKGTTPVITSQWKQFVTIAEGDVEMPDA